MNENEEGKRSGNMQDAALSSRVVFRKYVISKLLFKYGRWKVIRVLCVMF